MSSGLFWKVSNKIIKCTVVKRNCSPTSVKRTITVFMPLSYIILTYCDAVSYSSTTCWHSNWATWIDLMSSALWPKLIPLIVNLVPPATCPAIGSNYKREKKHRQNGEKYIKKGFRNETMVHHLCYMIQMPAVLDMFLIWAPGNQKNTDSD